MSCSSFTTPKLQRKILPYLWEIQKKPPSFPILKIDILNNSLVLSQKKLYVDNCLRDQACERKRMPRSVNLKHRNCVTCFVAPQLQLPVCKSENSKKEVRSDCFLYCDILQTSRSEKGSSDEKTHGIGWTCSLTSAVQYQQYGKTVITNGEDGWVNVLLGSLFL